MTAIDQILNKLSTSILECSASTNEKEDMLQLLANLVVTLMKRDANE